MDYNHDKLFKQSKIENTFWEQHTFRDRSIKGREKKKEKERKRKREKEKEKRKRK